MKTTFITPLLVCSLSICASAATIVVDNTVDPGDGICGSPGCTLREAITAANTNPGADIINFNIPGGGVQTITPTSNLPNITDPVTIDGYTQPGASENTLAIGNDAVLLIELNGGNSVTTPSIQVSDCTIRGLVINRFITTGILVGNVANEISNTLIEGNFIGTNAAGTTDLGNAGYGVILNNASNNVVGGTTPAARNLISGNGLTGVYMITGTGNVVAGNYIGTNADGIAALPNDENGVQMFSDASGDTVGGELPGAGNLISGNGQHGINITDGGGGVSGGNNIIDGNLIGTDATGTAALGNIQNGIEIENSPDNTIGSIEIGARNVISGNDSGVQIDGATASGNLVLGNFIGTNAAGDAELGNDQNGVVIVDAPDTIIGGEAAGAGNVISGNGFGIQIVGAEAVGTQVQGNLIGTAATGTVPLSNSAIGVYIFNGSGDTRLAAWPGLEISLPSMGVRA